MATERDLKKIHENRVDFILDRENQLTKKVATLEKRLFSMIVENVIQKVSHEGGSIKKSGRNLKLTAAVQEVFNEFNKKINAPVISQFVKDIQKSMSLSNTYFKNFRTKKNFDNITKRSRDVVLGRLGVDEKGNLTSGGFLEGFLLDSSVKNQVAEATARNISAGNSISTMRDELKTIILGADDAAGGKLAANYRTFIYDTYQQVDRTYNTLMAEEIGLTAFRYAGGKIKTTRTFCCERNGQIFTTKEAEEWKKLDFQGKPKTGYNPIQDMGGYNCRHNVQYLPNEMVIRKRKDLEIRDGKLVKKRGSESPPLNKC